jgi:hypothetical protein
MKRRVEIFSVVIILILSTACATSYEARPLPFRAPSSYANATQVAGMEVAAQAYADPKIAEAAFGFDVRKAGFLPVEVIFDNKGTHPFKINPAQTFLEDDSGNLWPLLSDQTAYERATKYSQTKQIFKSGAYSGFLGATAGAVIGAAIGIVTGQGIGEAVGKGAALGAAAGATVGGAQGYASADEARQKITDDLNQKSLENRAINVHNLAYGFLFFPGEAQSAKQLRLQLVEENTGRSYVIKLNL